MSDLKIEFPCAYPIKVIGSHEPGIDADVLEVVRRFAPGTADEDVTLHFSRTRKYVSIAILIEATGEEQLQNLFEALKQDRRISMVL